MATAKKRLPATKTTSSQKSSQKKIVRATTDRELSDGELNKVAGGVGSFAANTIGGTPLDRLPIGEDKLRSFTIIVKGR
jgi:hypothetical protein